MSFPQVKFGICERCGRKGNDIDPDTEESTASTGYYLKEYEGKLLCRLCIIELEDEEHRKVVDDKLQEQDRFRARAGFEKT